MYILQARQMLVEDLNYFGTLMTLAGDADGMVSGSCHTTASTIRPGLQVLLLAASMSAYIHATIWFIVALPVSEDSGGLI